LELEIDAQSVAMSINRIFPQTAIVQKIKKEVMNLIILSKFIRDIDLMLLGI
jgi:hypothetical protein